MPASASSRGSPPWGGTEHPLGAPPGFGRIGRNHLDAQALHGLAELGEVRLVHLAPRFRRMPVVTPAIRVEAGEQAPGFDHFLHSQQTAHRPFFGDEEHGVMLTGGVVHGDDQVPALPRHPFMAATILMDHQLRPGRLCSALAMCSPCLTFRCQPSVLEPALHPGVAAAAAIPAIPGVEVLGAPPFVPLPIGLGHPQHLVHRRPPVRYLRQPSVDQPPSPDASYRAR